MNAYYSLFKMRLMRGMQYRTSALAGVATQFFWGFIFIMVFQAFYQSTDITQPISFHEIVQIMWLQQGLLMFIMLWIRDSELLTMITSGNIAYELTRPLDLYKFWYAKLLSQRLAGALLRFFPIILVASLMPSPYNLTFPPTMLAFVLFMVTLILGLLLIVTISMFIYISTFYTLSPIGSFLVFGVVGEFLSGIIIPVPLMPNTLQKIVYLLPFRYTADLPFRIYAGHIGTKEALISIVVQLFWIGLLLFLGKQWMKTALKRVVSQGG